MSNKEIADIIADIIFKYPILSKENISEIIENILNERT